MGTRKLQTEKGLEEDRKKKQQEAKKKARRAELNAAREDMSDEGTWIPDWLTGYYPGTRGSTIARALVKGFSDKDQLAVELSVSRKQIAAVEKKLRRLGYEREEVVRYRPPSNRLDFFKHERLAATPPSGDLPF